MDMYNKDRKYIHYENKFGEMLCYIDDVQPSNEDMVFVTIIAERIRDKDGVCGTWDVSQRNVKIAVDLRKIYNREFYEDYEEFCEKYWEAIL